MSTDPRTERRRPMIHNLTHSHTSAEKAGVGRVDLCISRITGRNDVHVTVGVECWRHKDVTVDELRELVACESARELALAAEAGWRKRRVVRP